MDCENTGKYETRANYLCVRIKRKSNEKVKGKESDFKRVWRRNLRLAPVLIETSDE